MSRPIPKRIAPARKAPALVVALVAMLVPTTAEAADAGSTGSQRAGERGADWTRTLTLDLSERELGLPAGASAQKLARAALRRKSKRIGLSEARSRLRLDGRLRLPAADGARAVSQLRFQQTVGSLRLVWSQIDVAVVAGRVRSINATVVPAEPGLAGRRRVNRSRALRIARRAVPDAEAALPPLAVAYAGTPSTDRAAKRRPTRRAWVVEVQPPPQQGAQTPSPLCIVVDAQTGRVIARWAGIADRPDRGPSARGAQHERDVLTVADARDKPSTVLEVHDGASTPTPGFAPLYSQFSTTGGTRQNSSWPSFQDARLNTRTPTVPMEAISANAANVARTICVGRGWCGERGGFQPGTFAVSPWTLIGNVADSTGSKAFPFDLHVQIIAGDRMQGTGDPNLPFNDVVAHEFGHVMDWVYAGDRNHSASRAVDEVEEGLADMFAYDYDREDATIAEEAERSSFGVDRNWANPGAVRLLGQPYPAHMDDYDSTPPATSGHFNSTILGHAYHRFVLLEGHGRAGRVLHNVPSLLSPRPTFAEVARAFRDRAFQIYGANARGSADAAFSAVGLAPS